jgi:hypothetical protein
MSFGKIGFKPLQDGQTLIPPMQGDVRAFAGLRLELLFVPQCVPSATAFLGKNAITDKAANKGRGISMRVFIACAIILTAAVGLGGCWGHHEKAVVAEPLKLG